MAAEFAMIFGIVVVVTVLIPGIGKVILINNLTYALNKGDYSKFYKIIDFPVVKIYFRNFEREYFRLNAYLKIGNKSDIEKQLKKLLVMKTHTIKEEKMILMSAFSYYLNNDRKEETKNLLPRMKELLDENEYQKCRTMYGVYLNRETKYIEEMEEELKTAKEMEQGILHYMLSLQYGYMGNKRKEEEHLKSAQILNERAVG